jgi:hypothetical protein
MIYVPEHLLRRHGEIEVTSFLVDDDQFLLFLSDSNGLSYDIKYAGVHGVVKNYFASQLSNNQANSIDKFLEDHDYLGWLEGKILEEKNERDHAEGSYINS